MNEKFTPGPWTWTNGNEEVVDATYEGPGGYYDNPCLEGQDGTIIVGCGEYNVFNKIADKHLIAAAPELYEALQKCAAWIERNHEMPGYSEVLLLAMQALAKARGEVPK